MRDIPILLGFAAMLPLIFMRPHVGVLAWCWTALLVPNFYVYGLAAGVRFNFWIAICTLLAWLMSREPKRIPWNATTALFVCFLIWGTLSAFLTIAPVRSVTWVEWEKFAKTIILALVAAALIRTELRIKAVLAAIALAMGFQGGVEALKFILSGGGHKIWGPGTSIIGDNNQFAVAILMTIPILIYLYMQVRNFAIKCLAITGILLLIVTVIGTGSRGGLIGVLALGAWVFVTSKKKVRVLFVAVFLGVAAISFAPPQWFHRMSTIESADQDSSFMGRVIAWKINTIAALDHPLTGAGFRSTQELSVWLKYAHEIDRLDFIPTGPPDPLNAHAAHSIYFQVLGDMGFVGFAIFVALLVTAWRNASEVIVRAQGRSDLQWAGTLARTFQYCLIPYLVSGAALNLAYWDLPYIIFALLAVLRAATRAAPVPKASSVAMPAFRYPAK